MLKERIKKLLSAVAEGVVDRDIFLQVIFLSVLTNQPLYIFGRSGAGKSLLLGRVLLAFKANNTLRYGRRRQTLPETFEEYDIMHFNDFDVKNEETKRAVQVIFQEFESRPIVITGSRRPESVLSEAGIIDSVGVALTLPETLSTESLKQLLAADFDESVVQVQEDLRISNDEKKKWLAEMHKVKLTSDVLDLVAKLSEDCDEHHIYVSIRKWKALIGILKAMAYCNDRREVLLSDAFILGMPIWNRTSSNEVLNRKFFEHVEEIVFKGLPDAVNIEEEAAKFRIEAERLVNASDDVYETQMFAGESCVKYQVTVAGEMVPLYAPEAYLGTSESFHPYNELRKKEVRVLCNFNGTSLCSISIDSAAKGVGLRSAASANAGKSYEHFARLPARVLSISDPEKRKANAAALSEFAGSVEKKIEVYANNMRRLKDIYRQLKTYTDDPFFNAGYYNRLQETIQRKFEKSNEMIKKLKETRAYLDTRHSKPADEIS